MEDLLLLFSDVIQKPLKKWRTNIFFFQRTLNDAQENYGQVEREALALIAAVKKFYKFLYALIEFIPKSTLSFCGREHKMINNNITKNEWCHCTSLQILQTNLQCY